MNFLWREERNSKIIEDENEQYKDWIGSYLLGFNFVCAHAIF